MANKYIKNSPSGQGLTENTNPDGTDFVEIDDGTNSESVQLNNLFDGAASQGDVIYHNGTKWKRLAAGTSGYVLQTNGASSNPSWTVSSGGDLYNYLINGGFDLDVRMTTSGTLQTLTDKGWGADRWQVFAENASWQYARTDANAVSGLTSKYYGQWKKITNTGKGIFAQKVESFNTIPLRSKTVVFQIKLAASSSKTIKIALLELQTAATIDTFPAALASAFGADTVNPTWGTNVAVIGSVASCSVTTSIQSFSVSGTVPADSKNLVCVVWTDSQFAANDILYMGEAGLFVSSSVQAWKPRLFPQEQQLAERYCRGNIKGAGSSLRLAFGQAYSSTNAEVFVPLRTEMRITPSIVVSAASHFKLSGASFAGIACTALIISTGATEWDGFLNATVASGLTAGDAQFLFSDNTSARLYFEAEIA